MKQFRLALVGLASLLTLVHAAWGQEPRLRMIAVRSIIEGDSLGGVRLGATEQEVVQRLGRPPVDAAPAGESASGPARLVYALAPGESLTCFFEAGRLTAILLSSAPSGGSFAYRGRTARGIGLRSSVAAVRAAYGEGTDGRLWYPESGIAFNVTRSRGDIPEYGGPAVFSILVLSRGAPLPAHALVK